MIIVENTMLEVSTMHCMFSKAFVTPISNEFVQYSLTYSVSQMETTPPTRRQRRIPLFYPMNFTNFAPFVECFMPGKLFFFGFADTI